MRARNLVEPALRYLAYWMLTRNAAQTNVTRRELVRETATYFQTRGFDELHDAEAAAEEFVDFCRGRAWVFTDVGSTASGEQLYTFTHRTFLEYFAAYYVASVYVLPETLARALAPKVALGEWDMVGQLAVQMKDRSIGRGGERVFAELLGERRKRSAAHRANVLAFLARCLSGVQPRPSIVRELAVRILEAPLGRRAPMLGVPDALTSLLENWQDSTEPIASVLSDKVDALLRTDDYDNKVCALELACCLPDFITTYSSAKGIWKEFAAANAVTHASEMKDVAAGNNTIWWQAVTSGAVSVDEAIAMLANDLSTLFRIRWYKVFGFGLDSPIYEKIRAVLAGGTEELDFFAALGRCLTTSQDWPKVHGIEGSGFNWVFFHGEYTTNHSPQLDASANLKKNKAAYIGLLFCLALGVEAVLSARKITKREIEAITSRFVTAGEFVPYILCRLDRGSTVLAPLDISPETDSRFAEWAVGVIGLFRTARF